CAAMWGGMAARVGAVPMRGRKVVEIDVGTLENVLLHRSGCDELRRDAVGKEGAAELDQLARMRVRRQPQHHRDAAVTIERGAEDAAAAALRPVVVLDVVE